VAARALTLAACLLLPQVKSVLLSRFAHKGDAVLVRPFCWLAPHACFVLTFADMQDLACGKGGDLPKWREAGISAYVGVDIATESVRKDARERYNNKTGFAFPAALFVADAFEAPLSGALADHLPFDLVSCQFALHYAFSSEQRARRALQNVAELLRPGGYFIGTTADADVLVRKLRAVDGLCVSNSVFSCVFDARFAGKTFDAAQPFGLTYKFTLADAVEELPEYLVHRPTLEKLAAEVGLQLTMWQACVCVCVHAHAHLRVDVSLLFFPPEL
jgi:mRNA (guanine-N7-)-methyltransferase